MKDCKQNQIRNPATGRCVSKTGKIGKEILENQKGTKKPTPAKKTKQSPEETLKYFDITFHFIVKAIPMPGETIDDMVSFDDGVYRWIEENANRIIAPLFGNYAKNIRDVDIDWEGWNPLYKIKFTASVGPALQHPPTHRILNYLTSPEVLDNYNIYNHELHEKNRKKYKLLTGFNRFQISYELDSMKMYNEPSPNDYKIYIGKHYHEIDPDWCTI